MRLIYEPKVYLVGVQQVAISALMRFMADEGSPNWATDTGVPAELLAEVAGRLCYKSYARPRPGGNAAYLKHILKLGHGSVVEHAVFNFIITGVSRSLTHELVRHRVGFSYSQRSQRYCDESSVAFVVPPKLVDRVAKFEQDHHDRIRRQSCEASDWYSGCFEALGSYTEVVARLEIRAWQEANPGVESMPGYGADLADAWIAGLPSAERTTLRKQVRESARSVLPNAVETQIFVTANVRSLRHFLESRGSVGADAEIRRLALAMLPILVGASPNLFGDYEVKTSPEGVDYIDTPYRKV